MMHAIEELYFFGKYEEARVVACEVLKGKLNGEFKGLVEDYKSKCEAKAKAFGEKAGSVRNIED
jgi:hypothetical protein